MREPQREREREKVSMFSFFLCEKKKSQQQKLVFCSLFSFSFFIRAKDAARLAFSCK